MVILAPLFMGLHVARWNTATGSMEAAYIMMFRKKEGRERIQNIPFKDTSSNLLSPVSSTS